MISPINLTSPITTSSTYPTTNTSTAPASDDTVFFPTHTPAGAFLSVLYKSGFIKKNGRVNPEAFANVPFPCLFSSQLQALYDFISINKIHITIDSNQFNQPSQSQVIAEGDMDLETLHRYLNSLCTLKYGVTLNPLLIGGYLRYVLLMSLDYCQVAFEKLGLPNVNTVITGDLLAASRRFPPDGDFKYLIPPSASFSEFTDSVVKFLAAKCGIPWNEWEKGKGGLANLHVPRPLPPSTSQGAVELTKPTNSSSENKVRQFGLVSFPKLQPFKVDVVFEKGPASPNSHAGIFYNMALDLNTMLFATPAVNCWQAFISQLGLTVHFENLQEDNGAAWPLLLSYYLRGYVCGDKENIDLARQMTLRSAKGVAQCLTHCWETHLGKDPYAAMALTFQACVCLKEVIDPLHLWKQMRWHWANLKDDNSILALIDHELRIAKRPFEDVMNDLQVLAFFDLFFSNNPHLKADLKSDGVSESPLLQIKIMGKTQPFFLLLPWDFEKAFQGLSKPPHSFLKFLYPHNKTSKDFGSLLLKYKQHLNISWEKLRQQANALLSQSDADQQCLGYQLLLCCQLLDPKPEALQKLSSHHLPMMEDCIRQLNHLLGSVEALPPFQPNPEFIRSWILSLASQGEPQAKAACELWKSFHQAEDFEILKILFAHHPSLAFLMADDILKDTCLKASLKTTLFEQLLKNCRASGNLATFERVVAHAKSLTAEGLAFTDDWNWFFQELNRQNRRLEGAELLCLFAKNKVFNPDNPILDALWLQTCEEIFEASPVEFTGKLTANIYKQRVWNKGWKDEGHIQFLCKLTQALFQQNDVKSEEFGNCCLNLAYKHAEKHSHLLNKIQNLVAAHFKEQIRSRKIQDFNIIAKSPLKKYLTDAQRTELAHEIQVGAIITELGSLRYEAGSFLLGQLEMDHLTPEQQEKIQECLLQALKSTLTQYDHKAAQWLLKHLARIPKQLDNILDLFQGCLESKEGCHLLGNILLDPQLSPLFPNVGAWNLKCLKGLHQFNNGASPLASNLLIDLLQHTPPEAFDEVFMMLHAALQHSKVSEPLKQQITLSLPSICSTLRQNSKHHEVRQFIQLVKQNKCCEAFPEQVTDAYLDSIMVLDPTPQSIGHCLVSFPLQKYAAQAKSQVESLKNSPTPQALGLALDLLRVYKIEASQLWGEVIEKIADTSDSGLAEKSFEALRLVADPLDLITLNDWARCWYHGVRGLTSSNHPWVFNVLENYDSFELVFESTPQLKNAAFKSVLKTCLNQMKGSDQDLKHINRMIILDGNLLLSDSQFDAEFALSFRWPFIKKFYKRPETHVLESVAAYILLYLAGLKEKSGKPSEFIFTILSHLLTEATSKDEHIKLFDDLSDILVVLQIHMKCNAETLTLLLPGTYPAHPLKARSSWALLVNFINCYNKSEEPEEKSSRLIAQIATTGLAENPWKEKIMNYFLKKEITHPYLTAQDLTLVKQECLVQALEDAKSNPYPIKLTTIMSFLDNLPLLASDQKKFRLCMKYAIELALDYTSRHPSHILERLFIELNCFIYGINKEDVDLTGDFYDVVNLIKSKIPEKLSENQFKTFYELNKTCFEAIVQLKLVEYNAHRSPAAMHYSPFHKVLKLNSLFQFILCDNYLPIYHKQIFPLLSRYYFQRKHFGHEPLVENECNLFARLCKHGFELGYLMEIMEFRYLLLSIPEEVDPMHFADLRKSVSRVNSPDQLQIVLAYLQKIIFNKDIFFPLELYDKLFETLKTNPFFKYEINNQAISILFIRNLEDCFNHNSGTKHSEPMIGKLSLKMVGNFIELYKQTPDQEQRSKLNMRTTFLTMACTLMEHISTLGHCVSDRDYYKTLSNLFNADFGQVKESMQDYSLQTIYELMRCKAKIANPKERAEAFQAWIKEMIKVEILKNQAKEFFAKAVADDVFKEFPKILKQIEGWLKN